MNFRKQTHWKIVSQCFRDKDGKEYDFKKFKGLKPTRRKEEIEILAKKPYTIDSEKLKLQPMLLTKKIFAKSKICKPKNNNNQVIVCFYQKTDYFSTISYRYRSKTLRHKHHACFFK